METERMVQAWENFVTALHELVERFREFILNAAKNIWGKIKEAITVLEYKEPREETMLYFWQEQRQLHQHQVINRMKVQENIMRSYQQPWKAWKAQRR